MSEQENVTEKIVAEAQWALTELDRRIEEQRAVRLEANRMIKALTIQRVPLARLVRAATPRRQDGDHE